MIRNRQLHDALSKVRTRVREALSLTDQSSDFDVFISYRQSEGSVIARQVFEALRRGRHPRSGKALRVFLDDERIKAGQNIHTTLQSAIRSSSSFVVLLTPTYGKTEYTTFEQMLIAGEDWGGLKERVIPILVQECEVPERLRPLKYFDLRALNDGEAGPSTEAERPIMRMYWLEVPQERLASCLATRLKVGPVCAFRFVEEAGDLVPDGSYLELKDGVRISFSWPDIQAAMDIVCEEAAGGLLRDGFFVSEYIVKQLAERYGQDMTLPQNEPIRILLQRLEGDLSAASREDLAHALPTYAFELPSEFDRSHLSSLPRPSPSWDILAELIKREAWREIKETFRDVASASFGIAILWACEIVRVRGGISDSELRRHLEQAKPPDSEAIRTWAERLLNAWL